MERVVLHNASTRQQKGFESNSL